MHINEDAINCSAGFRALKSVIFPENLAYSACALLSSIHLSYSTKFECQTQFNFCISLKNEN